MAWREWIAMRASVERKVWDRERRVELDPANRRLAYRPAELAAMVGLSAKAIYRAIERGELEAARVANGSRLLVPAAAAKEWLVANAVVPHSVEK
jgi:excisionase family DNA binding protein